MQRTITPIVSAALACSVLLQSCATIINGSKQSIRLTSVPANTQVTVNGKKVKHFDPSKPRVKVSRRKNSTVWVSADGYTDYEEIVYPNGVNPAAALTFLSIVLVVPYLVDASSGAYYKVNTKEIKPILVKIPRKTDGSQPVACNTVSLHFKGADKLGNFYIRKQPKEILYFGKTLDTNAENLVTAVNRSLKDFGFTVPEQKSQSLFANSSAARYTLSADLQTIRYDVTASSEYEAFARYQTHCETTVVWKLLNRKNETVLEQTTSGQSTKAMKGGSAVFESAFENAFYTFLGNEKVYALLNKQAAKTPTELADEKTITLPHPVAATSGASALSSAAKSVVTIETADGHGSGCLLSADGYIVTNYHVVSGAGEIGIRLAEGGEPLAAELVRVNEQLDLALLKVKTKTPLQPLLLLPASNPVELGADIFAIGTPADKELGQTITKGIISGQRKIEGRSLIQTDVSINPGNSGGALVTQSGQLVGIINAKVVGRGIEGLGFAIPMPQVLEALRLQYAN